MKDAELRRLVEAYRDLGVDGLPWYFDDPPPRVLATVRTVLPRPSRVLELGCGAGVLARALASLGHGVLAVDAALPALVTIQAPSAGRLFRAAGDVRDPFWAEGSFDMVLDWELLHHIPYADRGRFIAGVARALRPAGLYLSASFTHPDRAFPAAGPVARTPLGTTLHLTEPADLPPLLEPWFEIVELERTQLRGQRSPHDAVWLLARRR